jgi:predicted nucleic acid-binding protein
VAIRDSLSAEIVTPTLDQIVSATAVVHPKDAPIVAAAVAANATHLVTFDRKHLMAKREEIAAAFGLTVITPDQVFQ